MQEGLYTSSILSNLPPQMVNKSEKDDNWKQDTMDTFETIARSQLTQNVRLIENYEMVKGKFIFNHYFEQEEYVDMISQLTREFELPSYLRHYDIISQVINTLSGEWQGRPDIFKVKGHDEKTSNDYIRTQTDLLLKYVMGKINATVSQKLLDMGLDENKKDFNSPEEQQQYQQQIDQAKQQLTPPEIQDYMKMNWFTAAELWGQNQLELDRRRFKLAEKEKREFEDMLIADRCFRHYYITGQAYNQETWNPVNVFFHKSPDIDYVEDGDYVGRGFYLTIADIIDRYGWKMTKDELEGLQQQTKDKNGKWNYAKGTDYVFDNYMVPFRGYPEYDMLRSTQQPASGGVPYMNSDQVSGLYGGNLYNTSRGYFFVVESYWKSQKKIGKVVYIDPNTGLLAKMLVDEDFIVPQGFTELDSAFGDEDEPNTVTWTWINEVWKGVKICTKTLTGFQKDIYLDINPLEFQFKGDLNPYEAKLPVCGQVFSIRNSQSMSLVDLMKPHQIGYNVAMNQLYQIMQKEVGKFIVMDVNMFPDLKDWGGDKAYERFMLIAKELGVTVADTSQQNTKGSAAAAGGHMPKEINLDETARMQSRLNIALAFETFALKQIGFNEYRLGQQQTSASATGIKQGVNSSTAQTESYFTNFSNYVQRCHKMDLDIAQYVQSQQKDITVSYIKSDMSRAFIKLAGTDLLLSDLHIYISNSQEELRQLESLRQLALSNNTTGASLKDLADVITSNSPAEIMTKLVKTQEQIDQYKQQSYEIEQQKIEQQKQIEMLKLQQADEHSKDLNATKKEVAYITTFNRQPNNLEDTNSDNIPDALEYEKLGMKKDEQAMKLQQAQQKNQLDREKAITDREYKLKNLELKKAKMQNDLKIQNEEIQYAKIMKSQTKDLKS